jgi:DNA-binding GntR family transcriptional regulator
MELALNGLPWSDLPTEDEALMANEALITIDKACHEIVYEAANNEFLQDTLITHYALSLRLWYFFLADIGDMRQAILEHKRILKALKARDAESASQLMKSHIQAFQEEIQSVMLGVPA